MKIKIIVSLLFVTIFFFVGINIFKGSYAEEVDSRFILDLYNNDNMDILKEDMIEFINLVDNDIIVNSSYNLSSVLNKNYDFLTKFVISFVLNNSSKFDIIQGNDYTYIDDYGNMYVSNKYIDIKLLYDITYKIFGIDYYLILDENLVVDDKVILLDYGMNEFNMKIDKITKIDKGSNYYDVYVKYIDNEIDYIYRFDIIDNNRLVINNLSIGE